MPYKPGDVVYCKFPLREDPLQFTKRPALVMRVLNGGKSYKMAQITGTDRSGQLAGRWIKVTSKEAKEMRLSQDSFVNLSNILEVPAFAILRFLGTCPILSDFEKECNSNGINY